MTDYGDPRLPQRFWDKVYPCPITGCWLWGNGTNGIYGLYFLSKRGGRRLNTSSHAAVYRALIGPIRNELDHLCRQPLCCNPLHLEDVTHRVNLMRSTNPIMAQAAQTTCKRKGHPLSGENLYISPDGRRGCFTCRREGSARSRAKLRNVGHPTALDLARKERRAA